ncbi:MAG: hypothetical protein PHU85_13305 [Phycisphaerae bacterium]|nr:hypothetical protein [Phycisphaerae bacterium]
MKRRLGAAAAVVWFLSAHGCTASHIKDRDMAVLKEKVKTTSLLVGLEGLQPFSGHRAERLVQQVAKDTNLTYSATSGNYQVHLPLIREAKRHGQHVYLVGYSIGAQQARWLAELCRQEGLEIDIAFFLDPGYLVKRPPDKVPDNVKKAVFHTSPTYRFWVGVEPTRQHLSNPDKTLFAKEYFPRTDHGRLPKAVVAEIEREIARDSAHAND